MTEKNFDDNSIVVSISCITYNHAPYIRQCIDGFLIQQTNFAFEVLIHDDASTDGTTEIIKEYEAKYPDIIKPIYEEENQWVKGRRGSAVFNFPRARGKYIALCEGDDYWTDPLKLQKQVDFLEANPNFVICSHNYSHYYQSCGRLVPKVGVENKSYDWNFLLTGGWLFQPLTVLYRATALDLGQLLQYRIINDAVLFYHILQCGLGYFLCDDMAVYRIHSGGVWSGVSDENKFVLEYDTRLGIYEVDKSDAAAKYILTQFTKLASRKWLIKHYKMIYRACQIIKKHYGFKVVVKVLFDKIILGKNYRYSE